MSEIKTVQVNKHFTRAKFKAESFNEADRTVEVIFATETPTRSYDWSVGDFIEVLSFDPAHVNLTRLNSGAPVLDNHNKYGKTRDVVVGVVEKAWIENGVGVAKVRFSDSEDDKILMNKVKDGIVTGVSVGYDVFTYELTRAAGDGGLDTYKAINWEPTEISFTPVQADINSKVRSESETGTQAVIQEPTPTTEPPASVENNDPPNTENNTNVNKNEMEGNPTPAAEQPTGAEQTRAAQTAERLRIVGIQKHVRSLGLESSFADTLIDEGIDLPTAMTRALAEWEKKQPVNPVPNAQQVQDDKEKTRSAMTNALVLRINPGAATVMGADNVRAAADFKGMSLQRLAEESLIRAGVRTNGMTGREIAKLALGNKVRGLHHTTDFPLLLVDTVHRTLLAQYALQPRTFAPFTRKVTLPDFRSVTRARITDIMGNLEIVREGGEYKRGTMGEGGESYKLDKYGKIIGITWEAIVNDDLSAFTRIPQAFAAKAAQVQSNVVYGILTGNPVMADGKTLFHTDHGNTDAGAALSEASLSAAYKRFREQKTEGGDFINISPKFLIVGSELEFTAMKLTSTNFTPAKQSDVSVPALTGLQVIVEPRISGKKWYLSASPDAIDTIEYAFLDGEEELFIEQREGFEVDGLEIKARMVFGAKAIEWRSMYYNPGA